MSADGEMRGEIAFDLVTPATSDQLAQNVARAQSLGLPSTQSRKRLNIVANGPTAKRAPFDRFDGPTLALNGGLRQFTERGLAPTYWAACDPQALVADFLKDAPRETIYLVASKCHPDVFRALEGYDVRLWHVADVDLPNQVRAPLSCSITMCVAWEMRLAFGFTDLTVYGWDACYLDGEHHAGDARVVNPTDVTIDFGDLGMFETNHTWAAEAEFAQQFFQLARYYDMTVTLCGDGMMRAMQTVALAA